MPAARGSRGPRRGRGSCPKLLCAYRGCRSKRDCKNLGNAFSAPRDAVTESQCRPLHGACQTVRFCGPTHRRLAMSRDARQRGPREALELGQYTLMIETCLKVGAPWLVPLTLLQLVCGERAECICHARFSWLNHLNPKDSNPATIRIPQVNRKTKPREIPMAPDVAGLLHTWITKGLRGEAGSRWPFAGQKTRDLDTCLFPGLRTGGNKYRRTWGRQVSIRGYRKRLRDVADVLEQDRSQKHQQGERHAFDDFPLDRLGTHSFKRSAVVLMKDTCTSTALVGAIAGTTAKTLDRVYDMPTLRRQQGLVERAFNPVAAALRPATLAADADAQAAARPATPALAGANAKRRVVRAAKFCSQCGASRGAPEWACCPWCGHLF